MFRLAQTEDLEQQEANAAESKQDADLVENAM
jgi:hypothetical protein